MWDRRLARAACPTAVWRHGTHVVASERRAQRSAADRRQTLASWAARHRREPPSECSGTSHSLHEPMPHHRRARFCASSAAGGTATPSSAAPASDCAEAHPRRRWWLFVPRLRLAASLLLLADSRRGLRLRG